jgi:hypothetical protein
MPTRVRKHNDNPWFFQSIPENSRGKIHQKEPLRHVCIILEKCRNVNEVTDDNTSEKLLHRLLELLLIGEIGLPCKGKRSSHDKCGLPGIGHN